MRIKFPYTHYHGLTVPILPVEFLGPSGWHTIWGFLDSGATYSILSHEEAQKLGLDYKDGIKISVVVGDGKGIEIFLHKLKFRIHKREFFITAGFSKELGVGFNLFGRKDLFEIFRVCFSDRYREITLTLLQK